MVKNIILALLLGFLGQIYAGDRTETPKSFISTSIDSDSDNFDNSTKRISGDKVVELENRANCCEKFGYLIGEACLLPIRLFIWSTGPKWIDKNH